jgi:hypothetical protein
MLGGVGAALVPLIVLGGLLAQLRQPARLAAMGIDIDRLHGLFWVNISALSMFAAFVWIAVYMRRNADSHKRLMILAAIDLMGPALGRMARWPAFGGIALETPHANEPRFIILCSLALLLTLVVYDLVVKRRLLATTWIGGLSLILSRVLAILVSQTAFGRSVIPALL